MANTFKNIVITPNIGNTSDPKIDFLGGNTTANTTINLYVYPDANGTLSFEGSAGQLFSITNDLANLLFSVSDVSGIPSLEVYANGLVSIAPLGGNVVVGAANAGIVANSTGITTSSNTTVNSSITAALLRIANSTGSANLTATSLIIGNTTIQTTNTILGGTLAANGGIGTAGQVLKSGGAGANVYWAADLNSGTVTSVSSGNGLTGGPITTTGTLSVQPGTDGGIVSNSTGVWVLAGNGLITNSTGLHVGAGNGIALAADAVAVSGGSTLTVNTTGAHVNNTLSITTLTTTGNITIGAGVSANGGVGSAGQVLASGGSGANVYWLTPGDITSVTAGDGLTGGGTSGDVTLNVVAANGITVAADSVGVLAGSTQTLNSTGIHVNSTLSITTLTTTGNVTIGAGVSANGGVGSAGQVLKSGGSGANVYWAADNNSGGTVTSVDSGNGLTGGPITGSGTLAVGAGNGISVSADAVAVSGGSTLTVNTAGAHVNSTLSITTLTTSGNITLGGTFSANGGVGSAGQILTSGGTGNTYWQTITLGDITAVTAGDGLTGGGTSGDVTLNVVAANGITVAADSVGVLTGSTQTLNSTGVHVNTNLSITTLTTTGNVTIGAGVSANGGVGTAGFVLKSGGSGANVYWAADNNSGGTVTSVATGNGLTGGTITTSGTLSVVAGTDGGLVSNATGVWVSAGNGLVTNSTGLHVGSANGITVASDTVGALVGSTQTLNSTGIHVNSTLSITTLTTTGNVTIGAGVTANGGVGTAGQVLTSGGSGSNVYWASAGGGGSVYLKGGSSTIGSLGTEGQNLFRVNGNTLNFNTTFVAGENAQATGPISVASGITLTIDNGARVSIV